jgi:hypothetical protein
MTKEETKSLYEGKFFYEVRKTIKEDGKIILELEGPFDNIYFVNKNIPHSHDRYEYVQVMDGTPKQVFTKEEILITDRVL